MMSDTTETPPAVQRVNAARQRVKMELGAYFGCPIFIRIIKEEAVLELWIQNHTDVWKCLACYPIAGMSGTIGPKTKEGDKQAPEGFYRIYPQQMNPLSKYHLGMNIGYPNAYDRERERTGSFIMIHGGTSSQGCFAMTDDTIEKLYILVHEALAAGAPYIPVQIYPFRMTPQRMNEERTHPHFSFWQHLQEGYLFTEQNSAPYADRDSSF